MRDEEFKSFLHQSLIAVDCNLLKKPNIYGKKNFGLLMEKGQ